MGFITDPIKSVTDYLARVNVRILENEGSELIFRGQNRYFEPDPKDKEEDSKEKIQRFIKSGATRRLEGFCKNQKNIGTDKEIKNDDLLDYTAYLIKYSQKKRYHIDGTNKFTYLELLAELQHFGAATILVDFTKNALVALFFACKSKPKNDGCVFIINKTKLTEADVKDFDEWEEGKKDSSNMLAKYFSKDMPILYYWEPATFNMRIPAQHSIFVFGKPEIKDDKDFIDVIIIDKNNKESILKELNDAHDINDVTLFNDLPGFASANDAESRIDNGLYNNDQVSKLLLDILKIETDQAEKETVDSKDNIENKRKTAELYFYKGVANWKLGKHKEAIENYSKAIELNPNDAKAYNNRGVAYENLGDSKQAIADYDKAIVLNPNDAQVYYNRGLAYGELGDSKKEIDDYSKAIVLNPNDAKAYNNRGVAYGKLGYSKKEMEDYFKAIELNPNDPQAYYNRGVAYGELGDDKKAIEDCTKAIKLNPNYAKALNNRAYYYFLTDEIDKALEDAKRSRQLVPNSPYSCVTMGRILHKLGKDNEALESFNKAIEIDPKLGGAYYWRGKFFGETGEKDKAEADFKKAKELGYEPSPNDK